MTLEKSSLSTKAFIQVLYILQRLVFFSNLCNLSKTLNSYKISIMKLKNQRKQLILNFFSRMQKAIFIITKKKANHDRQRDGRKYNG